MRSELHVGGHGWQRTADGGVALACAEGGPARTRFSARQWAQIVAHVSARGGTSQAEEDARMVHELEGEVEGT